MREVGVENRKSMEWMLAGGVFFVSGSKPAPKIGKPSEGKSHLGL